MKYKGYVAGIEVDDKNKLLHGRVLGIKDVITFEGAIVAELHQAFVDSVDDYLEFCQERGTTPPAPPKNEGESA